MTNSKFRASEPATIDEALRDRCVQYLLGELSTDQCRSFEQNLAELPELGEELARQSEIICKIADGEIQVASMTPLQSTRWMGILVTLAACLLVAYTGFHATNEVEPQKPSEDVLIAQAWAETDTLKVAQGLDLDPVIDWGFEPQTESQDLIDDASLSWLMSAVEIEGDSVGG